MQITSDIELSGAGCTTAITPNQLVQSSSENDKKGVSRLQSLQDHKWLGLQFGPGSYDLRYTDTELVLAILKLNDAQEEEIVQAKQRCADIQTYFRQEVADREFAHISVVSEHSPYNSTTSWMRALQISLIIRQRAPSLYEEPTESILDGVGAQMYAHYKKNHTKLPNTGRWLGYLYHYRKGVDPIRFSVDGDCIYPVRGEPL